MRHAQFGLFLVAYAFCVGHFNLLLGLASALAMIAAYRRHGGRLRAPLEAT